VGDANSRDQDPSSEPFDSAVAPWRKLLKELPLGDGSLIATAVAVKTRLLENNFTVVLNPGFSRYQLRICHSESHRMSPDLRLTKILFWFESALNALGAPQLALKAVDRLPYAMRLSLLRKLLTSVSGKNFPRHRKHDFLLYKEKQASLRVAEKYVRDDLELDSALGIPTDDVGRHSHPAVWNIRDLRMFAPVTEQDVRDAEEISEAVMPKSPPMVGFIRPYGAKYKTSPDSPLVKVRMLYWLQHSLVPELNKVSEARKLFLATGDFSHLKVSSELIAHVRKAPSPKSIMESPLMRSPDGSILEPYPKSFSGIRDLCKSLGPGDLIPGYPPDWRVSQDWTSALASMGEPIVKIEEASSSLTQKVEPKAPVRTDLQETAAGASVVPSNRVLGLPFDKTGGDTRIPSIEEIHEISISGARISGEVTMFALTYDHIPKSLKKLSLEPVGRSPYRGIPEDVRAGWFRRHGLTVGDTESEHEFLRFLFHAFIHVWKDPDLVRGSLQFWRLICAQKCTDKGNHVPDAAKGSINSKIKAELTSDPPFHGFVCRCS